MWSSHATGPNIKEGGMEGVREVVCYLKDTFSVSKIQGVHKIFCFFEDFKKYIPDSGLSRFPLGVSCVHNGRSNTSTAAELAELRKLQHFKKKHNI